MTVNVSRADTSASLIDLPRARALTDAMVAPGQPSLGADGLATVTTRLVRALDVATDLAAGDVGGGEGDGDGSRDSAGGGGGVRGCVRIGRYQVAAAASREPSGPPSRPFRWSAQAARRRLALAAVRILVDRQATAPAEAVTQVMTDPCAGPGTGSAGVGSCAEWVASLAAPARAAVEAEATNWATRLWTAVEWDRLDPAPLVGAADRWWAHRGRIPVALRGRAEVRARTVDGSAVLLAVTGGWPGVASRAELALAALVDALAGGGKRCPARVVGWWPDCGRIRVVPIDGGALEAAAGAVVRAVEAALAGRVEAATAAVGAGARRSSSTLQQAV